MQKSIKVNQLEIDASDGEPITFYGKHSGKTLAGINLDFFVRGNIENEKIKKMFSDKRVQVDDPFVNRSYDASIEMRSSSYQQGRPEYYYIAELRETDKVPEFKTIEINGYQFEVLQYRETEYGNNEIGRHAVIRLSKEQLKILQDLFKLETVQIKRLGIDQTSLDMRHGGASYWSEHQENGATYYKRVVRFFPTDQAPSSPLSFLASGIKQEILTGMTLDLSVRFEALTNELAENKLLSEEQRVKLLNGRWRDLLSVTRIDEIKLEIERVNDAEIVL